MSAGTDAAIVAAHETPYCRHPPEGKSDLCTVDVGIQMDLVRKERARRGETWMIISKQSTVPSVVQPLVEGVCRRQEESGRLVSEALLRSDPASVLPCAPGT